MSDLNEKKLRQLDFTLLLVLRSLLRHRQASAAARELGFSPSAISHALTRLRRLFDDPLFRRRPHGLEPTPQALELGPKVNALLRDASAAMGLAGPFDPLTTTRGFRIAAPDHVGALLGPELITLFDREAPAARFSLRIAFGAEALDLLRRDEIDLAIGQFQRPLGPFVSRLLYIDRYCLAAHPDHELLNQARAADVFEDLDHVVVSPSGDFRSFMDDVMLDLGLMRRIVASAPRFSTALAMVARSRAVTLVPERFARESGDDARLTLHEPPPGLPAMHILAVQGTAPDPGLDWLVEHLAR